MKTLNNDIIVHRGETFTIDRTIVNKDNTPYIVSSELNNPYFLLTVTTTRYEQDDRYVYRKWLDLSDLILFKQTNIVNLFDLKKSAESTANMYTGFDDPNIQNLLSFPGVDNVCAYGWVDGKAYYYQVGDAVFTDGTNYKYWDPTKTTYGWTDYKAPRIVVPFTNDVTKEWEEQSYKYSINLVSGTSLLEHLRGLCAKYNLEYKDSDTIDSLIYLLSVNNIAIDVDVDQPIVTLDVNLPILVPTDLTVMSDLNGGEV